MCCLVLDSSCSVKLFSLVTFMFLVENVCFHAVLSAVIAVDLSLHEFSCLCYLDSGFLEFSVHSDLFNLLVINNFYYFSACFIPMQVLLQQLLIITDLFPAYARSCFSLFL